MNQEKVGRFIARCRKEKNLTQEQLAEKLGVSNKSVSRWENGRTLPDYSILDELVNIFEISLTELYYGEKVSKEKIETISDENLRFLFRKKYRKALLLKRAAMSMLIGILFFIIFYLIFLK